DVEPDAPLDAEAGTRLPTTFRWTITPKASGDRYLLLQVREATSLLPSLHNDSTTGLSYKPLLLERAALNGKAIRPDSTGTFELPVKVVTFAGVSRRTAAIVGALLAAFGYVLAPVVVAWLKKRLGLAQK